MSLQASFNTAYNEQLDRIGERMIVRMKNYLRREGKEASGELINSLEYEVVNRRLIFRATAKHAIYVHEGSKGHWAPPGALRKWVQSVGFAPQLSIESRDYLARKAIAEGPTRATPFIQDPLDEQADALAQQLETQIIRDLQQEANREP